MRKNPNLSKVFSHLFKGFNPFVNVVCKLQMQRGRVSEGVLHFGVALLLLV
jgi:hypothetical protein